MFAIFFSAIVLGGLMLIWSFIFDHDHGFDHGDHGTPYISTKVIGMFLVAFGALGALTRMNNQSVRVSTASALVGGLVFGLITSLILSYISKQQATSHVTTQQLLNKYGYVTLDMRGAELGEVSVAYADGAMQYHLARAEHGKELLKGTKIQVIDFSGNELVVRPAN